MMIRFSVMWGVWLGSLLYDLTVGAMRWFPETTLDQRLTNDFQIAWFIVGCWILMIIARHLNLTSA